MKFKGKGILILFMILLIFYLVYKCDLLFIREKFNFLTESDSSDSVATINMPKFIEKQYNQPE